MILFHEIFSAKVVSYMKKLLRLTAALLLTSALAGCSMPFFSAPWEGTWWGVQEAGRNWTGDEIQNLETFTFTKDGDNVTVEHRTQHGGKEIDGILSGPALADGGRLTITPANSKEVVFTYDRMKNVIETTLTNADGTPVTLKELTEENNTEMEEIRSSIVRVSSRPENKVNTTLSQRR